MKPFFLTYFFLASFAVFSQQPSMGARFSALSDAAVAAQGLWALQHNPAGLAFLQTASAGVSVENRFGLAELYQGCGLWAMPTSLGVFGVSVQHSGDALYNESKLGLAYARTFGESLAGALKFSYQTNFLGNHYGSRNAFLVEGGFQLRLNHKTTLGAYVFNPNRTLLSVDEQEPYQSVFRLGMQYKLSEKVGLFAEAKKQFHSL